MKKVLYVVLLFIAAILLLFHFDVIWKSPPYYKLQNQVALKTPIMDMATYMNTSVNNHRRPYIYTIESKNKGKAIIVGVEHTNDHENKQFDSIRHFWNLYKPTSALVEGRLGFFFKWAQNPIEQYGESGLTSSLAKKDGADLYSWEPTREDEIELLIQDYSAKKLGMFYSLRPFFGKSMEERENNPEALLDNLIKERTDYEHLKNSIKSWKEIDSIWQKDFPNLNWRTYNSGYGYPGYLHDIWNDSNLARDKHMVKAIIELVNKGETVFVTMGSSHAPRIEQCLKTELQ